MSKTGLPAVAEQRAIPPEVWSAMKNSLYPGAADESVAMVYDYCRARQLDPMLKPVHIVPMYIKDKESGDKGAMRDVVMPGIGLYRIQADRAGNYAGMNAPVFGPVITEKVGGVEISYPEWCEITVSKLMGDRIVTFTATEYWIENYATAGKDSAAPNSMWKKRPRAQLVKCTEAQALRKGWPELGAQPTAEEMEGKVIDVNQVDSGSKISSASSSPQTIEQKYYPQSAFDKHFDKWKSAIETGNETRESYTATLTAKGALTDEMIKRISEINEPINGEIVQ